MLAQLRASRKRYSWIWRNGYPFLVARRPTAVERLRAWGLAREQAARTPSRRMAAAALMTIGWTVASLWNAAEAAWLDRREHGGGFARRFGEYLRAALAHNALVPALRRLRSVSGLDPALAPHLLYDRETRIWRALNAVRGADGEDVQDKARFHAICVRHGLPVVPVLAAFASGETVAPLDPAAARRDLFVKPLRGNRGQGAHAWQWAEGQGWSDGSRTFAQADGLLDGLRSTDCVVQPCLHDAEWLRAAGSGGLSTVRLVTLALPGGSIVPAAAQLLLAKGLLSQEGALFEVDLANGRLTAWYDAEKRVALSAETAPQAFPFAAIPGWDAVLALATDAHRAAFPRFASLGWDVVMVDGEDGRSTPLLLEANQGWGMMTHQLLGGPLGLGPLGAAAEAWLAEPGIPQRYRG